MIDRAFARAAAAGEAALIPYLTAGDPSLERTAELLDVLGDAGADVIEVGVPFSDPVADGPTIQAASHRALAGGITLRRLLDMLGRRRAATPIVLMSYLNPLASLGGPDDVAAALADAGVAGLIVPDLPLEEAAPWSDSAARRDVDVVLLVAPTSPPDRAAAIAGASRGFVYLVSIAGTTGARSSLAPGLGAAIARLRTASPVPVAVGFGVSTADHVRAVSAAADGVVVGSRLVDAVTRGEDLGGLVRRLKAATRRTSCSLS